MCPLYNEDKAKDKQKLCDMNRNFDPIHCEADKCVCVDTVTGEEKPELGESTEQGIKSLPCHEGSLRLGNLDELLET